MGKISKRKKLKKKLRALMRAQMAEIEQKQKIKETPIKTEKSIPQKSEIIEKEISEKQPPIIKIKKENFTQKLNPYFSSDIKKALIIIGILIIVIVGIYLTANYTNWISLLSERISQLINL